MFQLYFTTRPLIRFETVKHLESISNIGGRTIFSLVLYSVYVEFNFSVIPNIQKRGLRLQLPLDQSSANYIL